MIARRPSERVYLDYNATSPLRTEVRAEIEPILFGSLEQGAFGNPSSVHWAGQAARQLLEAARNRVARVLSRRPSDIIFTSGGTEADNLALSGFFESRDVRTHPQRKLILSSVEHPAVEASAQYWAHHGVEIEKIPVSASGQLDLQAFDEAIHKCRGCEAATLVSVMAVNNETGIIHDLDEVRTRTQAANLRLHVDAVQAAGRLPAATWDADLVVLSGHKLGGLPGAGVLATRTDLPLEAKVVGGPQERGRRAGTESVAAAVSLAAGLELANTERETEMVRLGQLRDHLDSFLLSCPNTTVLNQAPRVKPVTTAVFGGLDGEVLLQALDLEGIAVSSGSACSSGSLEPSSVLTSMGIDAARARSAVRFSLGHQSSMEDIERVIEILPKVLERARSGAF